jgi:hypothetical protein
MLKVAFCQLDARDDYLTRYSPVAFYDASKPKREKPLESMTQEQGRLSIFLEQEYLTRLAKLQDEIAKRYEGLVNALQTSTPAVADDEAWDSGLTRDDYERTLKIAEEVHPGRKAAYYT